MRLELTDAEATLLKSALHNMIRANEGTLDGLRRLSLKKAHEPGNARLAEDAATRIVIARNILERF